MADTPAIASSSVPNWVPAGLAFYALTIFGGLAVATCFIGNDTLRTTMLTASIAFGGWGTYYFASSSDSAKKTDMIAAAPAIPAVTPSVPEPSEAEKALDAKLPA